MFFAGLLLKLIGIKKAIVEFMKNNWKWVLPLILVIAFSVFAYFKIQDMKKDAFDAGVKHEHSQWEKRIAEENKKNRAFELKLKNIVEDFGKEAAENAAARVKKETVYVDNIRTIVKNDPKYEQCLVDTDIINARNSIRANGPTGSN